MRPILTLVRTLLPRPEGQGPAQQYLFRVASASEVQDPCMKRIMELADGRTAGEVVEALYLEALRSGAWVADIGLWRGLFYQDVAEKIRELADLEYLQVVDTPLPERQR